MHFLDPVAKRFPYGAGGGIDRSTLATYKSTIPYADGYDTRQRAALIASTERLIKSIDKALTKIASTGAVAKSVWTYADLEAAGLLRNVCGINVILDRPVGTVQSGIGTDGQPWSRTYTCDYGFIPDTISPDGEEFDVYVGTCADSTNAYIITQTNQDGSYDEPKLMLCFGSAEDAIAAFLAHMPSWALGGVSVMPVHVIANLLNIDAPVAMSAVRKAACGGAKKAVYKSRKSAVAKGLNNVVLSTVITAERCDGGVDSWVITNVLGEHSQCTIDVFREMYEPMNELAKQSWSSVYDDEEDDEDEEPESSQRPTMMAVPERYKDIDFSPPDGVREAARRGLELHKDGMTGDGLEPATVAWANRIANGEAVSPEKARQGAAFFARNQRFKDAPKDSPAWASWMLWFGDDGDAWFSKLVQQMDARDAKSVDAKAEWSTAEMNDLPDSAFLYIAPGGEKDATGKTVPRTLRYFPVYDANGKLDLPHLRNALARIGQANIPQEAKDASRDKAEQLLKDATESAKSNAVAKGVCLDNRKSIDAISIDQLRELALPKLRNLFFADVSETTPTYQLEMWVTDMFNDALVCTVKGELYLVGYAYDATNVSVSIVGEPQRVRRTYEFVATNQPIAMMATAKESPMPVPVQVVEPDINVALQIKPHDAFGSWDEVAHVLRASGRNNDDVSAVITSLKLPIEERKRALATAAAFTSVMRWDGTPQPFRKAGQAEHPAVTAPLEMMFASPEEMGGWIGWIEPKDQKWFALVGAEGKARVWLMREACGSVCGPAYDLKRKDLAQSQVVDVAKSDERFDKLSEHLATNPPKFVTNNDGSMFTAKSAIGKRLVYSIVLEPHPNDGAGDAQSHTYDEQFCEDACHYFARFQILKDNHGTAGVILPKDRIYVAENYIAPCEMTLGAQSIKKGTWIMVVCIPDDELWAKVERGDYNAFSIEGHSTHTPLAA